MAQVANLSVYLGLESANYMSGINQATSAMKTLTRQLDPAANAQMKFNSQLAGLKRQLDAGNITLEYYDKLVGNATRQLEAMIAKQQIGTTASGQMRIGMQQLGYQLGDISQGFAMGTSAVTIFAQQSGQVIQALQLMGGEAKGMLAVLSGWQGALLSALAVALAPFVAKIFQGNDALDQAVDKLRKNADQTEINRRAQELFKETMEGVRASIVAATEANQKWIEGQRSAAQQAAYNAQADLLRAQTQLQAFKAQLETERASLSSLEQSKPSAAASADTKAAYSAAVAQQRANVQSLQQQVNDLQNGIDSLSTRAQQTLADVIGESVQRLTDPVERIRYAYEGPKGLIAQEKQRLVAAKATSEEMGRQLALLDQQEQKEIKAEQDRQSAAKRIANDNRQTGRQISLPEAEAIVKSIGGTITSATRSFAQQSVLYAKYLAGTGSLAAKPGHSDHELGNALDIAKTPGMSLAKIREAFTEAGVSIKQLLDEGNHFHVAWTADSKAAAEASRNEAAAIKLIRDASTGAFKALAGLDAAQHKAITKTFSDDAKSWDDVTKQAETAQKAMQDADIANEEELQQVRQDHMRDLGDLYYDLFSGGTDRLWEDFERQGFAVLAKLASQWTMAALNPAAGQDKGGFFSNLFSAIGKTFGGGNSVSAPGGTFSIPGIGSDIPYIVPGFGGFKAAGGPVDATRPYVVGEKGPELFVPRMNGSIVPNSALRGGSNDNRPIVIHIVGEEGAAFVPRVTAISGATSSQSIQIAQKQQAKRAGRRLGR